MQKLSVLIGFECSGAVRREFRARGHDAWSCDLLPAEDGSPHHIQTDVRLVLNGSARGIDCLTGERSPAKWNLFIGFPDCTYVCGSGIHWNNRGRGWERTEAAVEFFRELLAADVERIALENPVGILSTRIRRPNQTVQPYEFGDDASKRTCLWLRGLAPLVKDPARRVAGRRVEWPRESGKIVERWANQTDSGQNRLAPSAGRWMERARTYPGLARAMAETWG